MKIVRMSEAPRYEPEKDWKRIQLCGGREVSVEYFVKPARHSSPRHAHPHAQVMVVLEGKLIIRTDEAEQELHKGDAVFLEGNESHVVVNPLDHPSAGIDIFVPGRAFDFWATRVPSHS
ncbi:MAG: cupin domain-containing protein [Candidatus Eisenbacteria bacterium]|nr:cupin domain-containing protein [Candidatus Eisenbacteria bacterium]